MYDTDLAEFLELVYVVETLYRIPVDRRLGREESAAYFRQLRKFPMEIVSEAAERLPGTYPSFFPKAGEWFVVCEQVAAEQGFAHKERNEQQSRNEYLAMIHCAHEFVEEMEPEGSFFIKFDVCWKCTLAKPTINRAPKFQKAAQYLGAAMTAKA